MKKGGEKRANESEWRESALFTGPPLGPHVRADSQFLFRKRPISSDLGRKNHLNIDDCQVGNLGERPRQSPDWIRGAEVREGRELFWTFLSETKVFYRTESKISLI